MVNVGAPAGTMIGGPMYDWYQSWKRYEEDPNKYLSSFQQDVKATQFEPEVKAALEASVRYLASDLGPQNIRVNAVSAGPIKTLAASGISGFTKMLQHVREKAPLRRTVDASEIADAALFLLSPLSRGITGEILHVDGRYNIVGM